jgi:hypothetical protein
MQGLSTTFLALYLAHLSTDFVFQSDRMVLHKREGGWAEYAKHGAIHCTLALLAIGFANLDSLRTLSCFAVIFGLTIVHLLLDRGKVALASSRRLSDSVIPFLLDQILHAGTVVLASWLIVRTPLLELRGQLAGIQPEKAKILLLLVVYTGVIFGGGYLVRYLTKPMLKRPLKNEESSEELQNAGMYIGWLERFIVLTALLLQSPATVGLILTAKSIARYPEFRSVRFAEYFLVGTLLSISLGIVGGLILLKAFYGAILLSK